MLSVQTNAQQSELSDNFRNSLSESRTTPRGTRLIYGLRSHSQFSCPSGFLFVAVTILIILYTEFFPFPIVPRNHRNPLSFVSLPHLYVGWCPMKESLDERLLSSVDCSFLLDHSLQAPFLIRAAPFLPPRSYALFLISVSTFHGILSLLASIFLLPPLSFRTLLANSCRCKTPLKYVSSPSDSCVMITVAISRIHSVY